MYLGEELPYRPIKLQSRPELKLFSCSTQMSMKFVLLINLKLLINSFLLIQMSMKISLLIDIKMSTIYSEKIHAQVS